MTGPRQTPIGLELARAARTVDRAFGEALAAAGGSLPVWNTLLALTSGAARNQRTIAARVGIGGATLSHHLDAMETRGLLTRRRDPDNRRVHLVELTPAGSELFRTLRSVAQRHDTRIRAGLGAEDVDTLRALLQRVATNAAGD